MGALHTPNKEEDGEQLWEGLSLLPIMATLLLPIIIGILLLLKCLYGQCCVRKSSTKEEMYGVEGRMTILSNSDVAFLPSPIPSSANYNVASTNSRAVKEGRNTQNPHEEIANNVKEAKPNNNNQSVPDVTVVVNHEYNPLLLYSTASNECDVLDTLKRVVGKRELPELPYPPGGNLPRRSSSVQSHDGTSELYAVVGDVPNPYAKLKNRHSAPGDAQPSTSSQGRGDHKHNTEANPSSDSETYATNHPYAKLKRNTSEHPYARVRSNNNVNDEETDTDNYDMPQPYAQTRPPIPVPPINGPTNGNNNHSSADGVAGGSPRGPIPPRRTSRQWRRGSNQGQNSVDSASHFSGDSQDSRGYTSISVREPLSNIRNAVVGGGRVGDSHYATMSDDSEEMYAAIDDTSDGNYMQIPDGERPSHPIPWLGASNLASPIPERREANSPLPPVPPVPPPIELGASSPPDPTAPLNAPVYAQVTKKKKNKAPPTPTNANTPISSHVLGRDEQQQLVSPDSAIPGASSTLTNSSHHSHHRHHRNRSRTLMDNNNLLESTERRWSKADISYSEFEVVRESFVPSSVDVRNSPVASNVISCNDEILDEDNYNIIPERTANRTRLGPSNYQVIDPMPNTYLDIAGTEPSDHYQEIGAGNRQLHNGIANEQDSGSSGLYQEIRRPGEEDDDEEDQLYETVKPVQPSIASGKKHGYEKIKKKPVRPATKSDEEDDYGDRDDDSLYERMRYPPYERLKESTSDLTGDGNMDDDEVDNLYERIGYSKVKPKNFGSASANPNSRLQETSSRAQTHGPGPRPDEGVDVNQLYAVIDKTKKSKGKATGLATNINNSEIHNNNVPVENNVGSPSPRHFASTSSMFDSPSRGSGNLRFTKGDFSDLEFIDDDNVEIEYI